MPRNRKALLRKTVEALIQKADDCADLAQSQRLTADKQQEGVDQQHASAHKLDMLSHSLVDQALELNVELIKDEAPVQLPDGEARHAH